MITADDLTYADPADPPLRRTVIKAMEAATGKQRLWRLYSEYRAETAAGAGNAESFWQAALRKLRVTVDFDPAQLAKMPKAGPLVVVANHPYGVLDGLILAALIGRVRADYRILTHAVLCRAEEVRAHVLEVDFSGTAPALQTNLRTRKAARDMLRAGGCIAAFPAGGVSSVPRLTARRAADRAWQPFIARLVRECGATVVPIYFDGQNSRLFQVMSRLSMTLRTALFLREITAKMGSRIAVKLGDPIAFDELAAIRERGALCAELRRRTYALGGIDTIPGQPAYRMQPTPSRGG